MIKSPGMMALLCSLLIILGCSRTETASLQEENISVSALSEQLRGKNPPRVIYTGSPLQWRDARIPASRCVPCDANEEAVTALLRERDQTLVLYGDEILSWKTCPLVSRLARKGKPPLFILSGGLAAWRKNGLTTESDERIPRLPIPAISSTALKNDFPGGMPPLILDIRSIASSAAGPVSGALSIPLSQLHERYGEIPLDRPVVVADEDGTQTLLAASFLLRKGVPVKARLQGGVKSLFGDKREGGKSR